MIDEPGQLEDPFDEGDGSSSILRGAAKAAVLLTAAGLVGQVFTLLRELFVADKVGVSQDLDALLVAAVAPLMLAGLISSGMSAAMVPGYLAAKREGGRIAADRLLGATLTWTVLIGIALSIAVTTAAGLAIAVTGPGLDAEAREIAIGYVPTPCSDARLLCGGQPPGGDLPDPRSDAGHRAGLDGGSSGIRPRDGLTCGTVSV